MSERERSTAEPITAVIADQVRALRVQAGLTQAEVAERMVGLGSPWTRATVVNLEKRAASSRGSTGGRDSVTVQELLRLAAVFDTTIDGLLAQESRAAVSEPCVAGAVSCVLRSFACPHR